jgi:NAD(P)-dependent dehydrogenase (short-subunit alcohol dehydrogenase family)
MAHKQIDFTLSSITFRLNLLMGLHQDIWQEIALSPRCSKINSSLLSISILGISILSKSINNLFYFVWCNYQILMANQNNNIHDFSNKTVLVTGGTGALGSSITKAFLDSNATVISSYVNDREKGQTHTNSKSAVQLVKANVTNEEEIEKLVSHVLDKYGRIDILVNVVGAYIGGKSVVELEEKEWDLMMTLNLKSAFLISKHVTRQMISYKSGKIIHVSSRNGLRSMGYDSAYSASKSGLIRLVESLAEETKESNINVNCIMPTIIDTQANRKVMPNADFTKWVKPEDLANVVLFLSSDEAKTITGAAIPTFGIA